MGRPIRLLPSVFRSEGVVAVEEGIIFVIGTAGGPMDPRITLDIRRLRGGPASLESPEEPILARPGVNMGTLTRFIAFKLLVVPVPTLGSSKSGEVGRDVEGVGMEVRLLVKERRGTTPRFAIGDSSAAVGDLRGKAVGGGLLVLMVVLRRGTRRGGGETFMMSTQPGLSD